MKNKKSLLSVCLLVLVLILGVGYAVVSSVELTISGTATVKDANLKVSFNGTTDVSDSTKVTATATNGSLSANISVTDLTLGESVTATYTIQNEETDVNAQIQKKSITTNGKDAYFEVTTDVDSSPKTIAAKGGTTTVTVTVTLKQTPVESADSTANITVTLEATPVQP